MITSWYEIRAKFNHIKISAWYLEQFKIWKKFNEPGQLLKEKEDDVLWQRIT